MSLKRILKLISEVASLPEQFIREGNHTIGGKDWTEASAQELRQVVGHIRARENTGLDTGFMKYGNSVSIKMYEERAEQIEQGLLPDPSKKPRKRTNSKQKPKDV